MITFLWANSPNFFCFGFGSTRELVSSSTQWGGMGWSEGNCPKNIRGFLHFENGEDLWKYACGASREGIATAAHNTSSKEKGPILLTLSWNTRNGWTLWRAGDGVLMNSNAASHLRHLVPIPYSWLRPSSAICLPCFLILVFLRGQWVLLWVAGSSSIFLWMWDPIGRGKFSWLNSLENFFLLCLQ